MVYATTLSESQRMMLWRLIPEDFGPTIQHISGVENIVADTLSISPYTSLDKYRTSSRKSQCRANVCFKIIRAEKKKSYVFH